MNSSRTDLSNIWSEPQEYPSVDSLKLLAEEEFQKEFHKQPTYATFSPGCLNIAGEISKYNDGKILCMAIQRFIVIVGRKRKCSKWCSVKTLSEEIEESNSYRFYLNTNGLEITEEPSWINYVKGAIKTYKAARQSIPGFNVVIVSSIPMKIGLASSTALTLAIYTFLEAVTNSYTTNNFEKAIACRLAEKLATKESNFISEPLASVIGCDKKILEIDKRTLQIAKHEWNPKNVEWIYIYLPKRSQNSNYAKYLIQCREIAFATNTTNFRDLTIEDLSKLETLFPKTYINIVQHIINENNRVSRIVQLIRKKSWKKLGRTLWESYFLSKVNDMNYDPEVKQCMDTLKDINGVLGAKIIDHRLVGRIVVLVRKEAIQDMIKVLKNISNPEYYILRSASGVKILYSDKDELCKDIICPSRGKPTVKYYLRSSESFSPYYTSHSSLSSEI